jgi:uncharacterized membrane protein (DUF2068 family)
MPSAMQAPRNRGLLLIGLFKLAKATILFALGLGLLSFLHRDTASSAVAAIEHLRLGPHNAFVHWVLKRSLGLHRRQLAAIDAGAFLYAAVFATEGVGLLRAKRWAEYFTLVVTTSFVPIEIYEVYKHASVLKAVLTLLNVLIALYLARELRRTRNRN